MSRHAGRPLSIILGGLLATAVAMGCGSPQSDPSADADPTGAGLPTASAGVPRSSDDPSASASQPGTTHVPDTTTDPDASDDGVQIPAADTFDYDTTVPLDPRLDGRPTTTGAVRLERLTYAGVDGERVPALFATPRDADGPVACVLLGHGFRGDKVSFPIWDMLGRAGLATFAIDARFHGDRLDAAALERMATDPRLLARLLRETVVDMRRGVDLLSTRDECHPDRIGYLGASMGGFVGSLLAGADPRVQAPVLLVSGADWPTMLGSDVVRRFRDEATPDEVDRARTLLNDVDPKHWVGRISPRPVLMINGERDESVPPESARALHSAARDPKRVVWYDGGHAIPSGAERDRLLGIIGLWLLTHLSPR